MNQQPIESLVETIRNLSPTDRAVLWAKLDLIPTTESILLGKIHQSLPTTIQQRYDQLRSKLQAETITTAEHQELLGLTDTIEQFDAERLSNLLKLAQIRQVSLPMLLEQLQISTPAIYV